jgi:hypothetical protein
MQNTVRENQAIWGYLRVYNLDSDLPEKGRRTSPVYMFRPSQQIRITFNKWVSFLLSTNRVCSMQEESGNELAFWDK